MTVDEQLNAIAESLPEGVHFDVQWMEGAWFVELMLGHGDAIGFSGATFDAFMADIAERLPLWLELHENREAALPKIELHNSKAHMRSWMERLKYSEDEIKAAVEAIV